ncbi:ABC transporter permease [Marinicrinis lubricantis]|uniref:ABC transporter permease n=1 Tax=Marinicrinis lubricantis TaxID=2086470 RepID=A0ABW1IN55_9BACL
MLYFVLASKAYARNLHYRGAHMVHNIASALFGYMYACIWIGIGENRSLGDYGLQGMVSYIAFTQASLWISGFLTNGLGIPESVRTGQIALDLMRPIHLFTHLMSREWGQIAYQFIYKSIPIYLLYTFVFSLQVPTQISQIIYCFIGLGCAAYIAICIHYLIGASALWTTESSWLYWCNHALMMLLAGFFIPLEWLPDWLQKVSWMSPYPFMLYVPTRIYLGFEGGALLIGSLCWCAVMTILCIGVTHILKRKVEVQGG